LHSDSYDEIKIVKIKGKYLDINILRENYISQDAICVIANMSKFSRSAVFSILIILAVTFTMRMTTNMLMTSIPVLAKFTLLASTFLTALPVVMYAVTGLLANLFLNGRIRASRISLSIAVSLFVMAVSLPLFYLARNIWEVAAIAAMDGLSMGLVPPLLLTLISLAYEDIRDNVLGFYTSALSISLIAGTFMQGFLLSSISVSVRDLFLYFFPVPLISALLMLVLASRLKIDDGGERRNISTSTIIRTIPRLFRNSGFNFGFFGNLTYSFPFVIIMTYGSLIAKYYSGLSPAMFFYALTSFFFVSMVTRLTMSFRPPENRYRLMFVSLAFTIAGFIALTLSRDPYEFVISMVLLGFPHGSIYPIATMSVSSSVQKSEVSIAFATFNIIFNILNLALPAAFGYIAQVTTIRVAMLVMIAPMAYISYESIRNGIAIRRQRSVTTPD